MVIVNGLPTQIQRGIDEVIHQAPAGNFLRDQAVAPDRVDHVIRQACNLGGTDYLSTIRRMSTEVIFHGAGAAGKLPVPSATMFAKMTAEAAGKDAPAPARARPKA